jgi:hypothetical protein
MDQGIDGISCQSLFYARKAPWLPVFDPVLPFLQGPAPSFFNPALRSPFFGNFTAHFKRAIELWLKRS